MNNYNVATIGQNSAIIKQFLYLLGFGIGNNIFIFNLATFNK